MSGVGLHLAKRTLFGVVLAFPVHALYTESISKRMRLFSDSFEQQKNGRHEDGHRMERFAVRQDRFGASQRSAFSFDTPRRAAMSFN